MRRGYWRTLVQRMRAKVAAGENAFVHPEAEFSIAAVTASEDAILDDGGELPLAEDGQGNVLALDVDTAQVLIICPNGQRISASENLAAFVDTLHSLAPPGLELGPVIDEEFALGASPKRGILDDC
jgi:hypothetical protein